MTDPECEYCWRETMEWRSQVDEALGTIDYWLGTFNVGYLNGNDVLNNLNRLADELSNLGWQGGDRIPF